MSNSSEQTLEEDHGVVVEPPPSSDQNPNEQSEQQQTQEWETMARAWLLSFPEAKAVSMDEVEAWIDSNHHSLPEGIRSMPRSDVCQRLISIQKMRLPTQVGTKSTPNFLKNLNLVKFTVLFCILKSLRV